MSPRGGYQRPRQPAPVSNPGAGSKRTDSGPKVAKNTPVTKTPLSQLTMGGSVGYGDVSTIQALGSGLPTPASPAGAPARPNPSRRGGKGQSMLFRPSDLPDQPITDGMSGTGPPPAPLQLDTAIMLTEALISRVKNPSNELMDFYLQLRSEARRGPRA